MPINKKINKNKIKREPAWRNGKALGCQAEGLRFNSVSGLLVLQKLWSVDTVLKLSHYK